MNVSAIAAQCRTIASASTVKAASSVPEKDPTDKGTATPPDHPDGDNPAKTGLPSQQKPTNADNGTGLPASATPGKPGASGENVPSVAKTIQASGSEPGAEKLAASVKAVGANLREMAKAAGNFTPPPAAAPAPAAAAPAAAPAAAAPAPAAPAAPAKKKDGEKKDGEKKDGEKEAAATDMPSDVQGIFAKIAFEMHATEEGRAVLAANLERRLGQEAATQLLKTAAEAHAQEQAQLEKFAAEQAQSDYLARSLVGSLEKRASAANKNPAWVKSAAEIHAQHLDGLGHWMLKAAYMQGVDDAGATTAEGGAPAALPGSNGTQMPAEEIQMLLQQMVDSGEITVEEAEALFAEITGGGAAAGAEGGAPAAPGAEGAAAPVGGEAPNATPAEKAAAAVQKTLTKLASVAKPAAAPAAQA